LTTLYEQDETAWLEAMSRLLRRGSTDELDSQNLAEYLADMARRDRREVESRLATLIAHLWKWRHQVDKRSRSWPVTIEQQRQELQRLLQSRTLRNHADAVLAQTYADGRRLALIETGLKKSAFPKLCPFTIDDVLKDVAADDVPQS
jgi:hypothetical protein